MRAHFQCQLNSGSTILEIKHRKKDCENRKLVKKDRVKISYLDTVKYLGRQTRG